MSFIFKAPAAFIAGGLYHVRALALILRTPKLQPYVLVPIAINIVLGIVLYAGLLYGGLELIDEIVADVPNWTVRLPHWAPAEAAPTPAVAPPAAPLTAPVLTTDPTPLSALALEPAFSVDSALETAPVAARVTVLPAEEVPASITTPQPVTTPQPEGERSPSNRFTFPKLFWPQLSWPQLSWPQISWPHISWPKLSLPSWQLPRWSLPDWLRWRPALPDWFADIPEGLAIALLWLLRAVLTLLLLVVIGVLILQFGGLLGAPWYGKLSEELERMQTGQLTVVDVGVAGDIGRAILYELKKLVVLVGVGLGLLLLNLLPGLGTAIAAVGGIGLAAMLTCMDFLDAAVERRRLPFRQKLSLPWRSFPASASFALISLVLVSTPLINLVAIPVCVAAGTLFFCDRIYPWLEPPAAGNRTEPLLPP